MSYKQAIILGVILVLIAPLAPVRFAGAQNTPATKFQATGVNKTTNKTTNTTQYVNQSETNQLNNILNTIVSFIKSLVTQIINLFSQQAKAK